MASSSSAKPPDHVPYHSVEWQYARGAAKDRADWRCERCRKMGRLEVHHKKPVAQGGAWYDLENLEVLCRGCHIKHHHPRMQREEEFEDELKKRLG